MAYLPAPSIKKSAAPTTTDDSSKGYLVGATWVDTVARKVYVLMDSTVSAAIWIALGGAVAFTADSPTNYQWDGFDLGVNPITFASSTGSFV
jgi:hypothetical protein